MEKPGRKTPEQVPKVAARGRVLGGSATLLPPDLCSERATSEKLGSSEFPAEADLPRDRRLLERKAKERVGKVGQ